MARACAASISRTAGVRGVDLEDPPIHLHRFLEMPSGPIGGSEQEGKERFVRMA
jgi:hypothetical protein